MTGPREWRHAEGCPVECPWIPPECYFHDSHDCTCGLSAVCEGVYIAPDGTLMRAFPLNAYHPDRDDPDDYDRNVYRLVPIEEATDD